MIDRLRKIANQPVRELPTRLVFIACVLVIAIAAAGLGRVGDSEPPSQTRSAPRAHDPGAEDHEVGNPPSSDWDYGYSELPSEEGPNAAPVTREDGAQVRRATRRFMHGYLAFTYGHAQASEINGATPELIELLEENPPRVSEKIRRGRHPRIELVHGDGIGEFRAAAIAAVADGVTRYSVHVRLIRDSPDTWIVTEVGPG